jgi:hypothetical protein
LISGISFSIVSVMR